MQTEFKPIKVLNKRTFQKNKGRNFVAALAILLTTIMFTTLFTLAQSMNRNMVEMTFRQTGHDAQVSFKGISKEQIDLITTHQDVEEMGESLVLGLAENKQLQGKQVEIRWASDSYAKHSFTNPTTGTMPQNENEIAVDTIILDRFGLSHELGQTITLEWRKDLNSSEVTSSTFTICGFWEGNESLYASMAWVSKSFADAAIGDKNHTESQIMGIRTAQVTLKSDQNIEADMEKILADCGITNLKYSVNLAYLPEMQASAFQESFPMYLGMILVFIAGFLIIYNIFQISVTADIQFYGKLKTLGTTTKQIESLIYGQANRLCAIGIPLGLIMGWLLGMGLVPALMGMSETKSVISTSPIIFVGSAFFAWMTVTLSCMRPAYLAGKISPMEALRMNDASVSKKKTTKGKYKNISLSTLAWGNLGRNRKRTTLVICSLTLALVLLSSFYAKNASFDMEKYLTNLTIADFELADASNENYVTGYNPQGNSLNNELITQIEQSTGMEATGHQYSHQFLWNMDAATTANLAAFYTEDKLAEWSQYEPKGAERVKMAIQNREASAVVFGLDGIPLETITQEEYLLEGMFDADKFATGEYVIAMGPGVDKEGAHSILPVPSVGSQIELEGKNYTVMAVVYPLNSINQGAAEQETEVLHKMKFIIPTTTFREQWPMNTLRKAYYNVDDDNISRVQELLDTYTKTVDTGLPVTSRQSMTEQYAAETRAATVMGNAISIIIALVGVLNFINSMITAIVSRKREFAMIQSIGMTKKQLCQMLVFEGLLYAVLTLITSYIASGLAVGVGVRAMVEGGYSTFHFTLLPLAICTPILVVFAIAIPFICFKNLEKQSVVERLRTEG